MAWDKLRLITALKLYQANAEKFGRGLARTIKEPEMHAMVVFALLERDQEAQARGVLDDIPAQTGPTATPKNNGLH